MSLSACAKKIRDCYLMAEVAQQRARAHHSAAMADSECALLAAFDEVLAQPENLVGQDLIQPSFELFARAHWRSVKESPAAAEIIRLLLERYPGLKGVAGDRGQKMLEALAPAV